ncbi:conserved hypothetical protein, partial [Aspergillus lentulus]
YKKKHYPKKSRNGEPNPYLKIPECYIQNYPHINSPYLFKPHCTLSEVDEEVGHTIIYFLYTSNYETLRKVSKPDASKTVIEYRRSMLVY